MKTNSAKPNKCNQCNFVSSRTDKLSTHLKTHSGEKPNKCKQCNYASSRTDMLRTHLKTHSGEKLNKCNQCKYASSRTDTRLVSEPECLKSHKCVCHSKIRAFGLHIFSLSLCLHLWLSIRLGSNNCFFHFSLAFSHLFLWGPIKGSNVRFSISYCVS